MNRTTAGERRTKSVGTVGLRLVKRFTNGRKGFKLNRWKYITSREKKPKERAELHEYEKYT